MDSFQPMSLSMRRAREQSSFVSLCRARQPQPQDTLLSTSPQLAQRHAQPCLRPPQPLKSLSLAPPTNKTTGTPNDNLIDNMADKDSSDSGKGTGATFSAKDLGFKVPGTGSDPMDERIFNQPPKSWPELVGK